jgi:site-specific DNA recombinase
VQKDLRVLQVFKDSGQSARTSDRPEFQRMLAYCAANRRQIGYVVVQDLSRFARNNRDQAEFISELGSLGMKLCSVYEPNVDDTAAGKLAANIHGTFNQYFSDALSEKMKDRTRAAVLAGRFPWPAPIGYLNDENPTSGANIVPDPERAPLIRKAFEMIATGQYKKTDVLKAITDLGLQTRKGKKLSAQTFEETLKKPIYCGYTTASFLEEPVKGLHQPIVSEELFKAVQDVLTGKRVSTTPKRKHNPELPLKCFVRCSECGTPLTGGMVTGKNKNNRFGYYWCRRPECRAVMVRRETLERLFVGCLQRLRPDRPTAEEFSSVAAQVWNEIRGDAKTTAKAVSARLEEQKRLKSELLLAKLRHEINQSDYVGANALFDREIAALEEKLAATTTDHIEFDAFVRFGQAMLLDIAQAWQLARPEQKIGVQKLLFQDGISYSQETGEFKHLNPCLFNVMEGMQDQNWWLASPTGFEPVFTP